MFLPVIQIRENSFSGQRPECPKGCRQRLHRHGAYSRFKGVDGTQFHWVQRFCCPSCRRTVSVLPECFLPYRSVPVDRLQAHLDRKAGIGSGLDPPPSEREAGCLKRAWSRFALRSGQLRQLCGQLLPATITSVDHLWTEMRRAMGSLKRILQWLAATRNTSFLGDYACVKSDPGSENNHSGAGAAVQEPLKGSIPHTVLFGKRFEPD